MISATATSKACCLVPDDEEEKVIMDTLEKRFEADTLDQGALFAHFDPYFETENHSISRRC